MKRFPLGEYDLDEILPADVITVHKSQGGEYEDVYVMLPGKAEGAAYQKYSEYGSIKGKEESDVIYGQKFPFHMRLKCHVT